ncbi:MAG: glycosyltransferase family 2 protein [Bacteroidetes bacterium]|nr:glycosyltransferase family 2 protein [Bacteroidota bacterium]
MMMNHVPVVSVIMPVYNGARTVKEAIDSVLTQTFFNFELIICNDASTDETRDILDSITDNRLRILHNDNNIGGGLSRDRAISQAQGFWLAVIDADDTWAPERLETLLSYGDEESNNFLIFDDVFECHDTPSGMRQWKEMRGRYAFDGNGFDAVGVTIEKFVCSTRLLIKPLFPLCWIKKYKIFHSTKKFGEDTEFFLRLMMYGIKLRYVPKPMYYYRITPGSMTSQKNRTNLMIEVLEDAIENFTDRPSIQAALLKKIALVSRDDQYMPFIWALKEKKFAKLFQLAGKNPWLISEFFHRAAQSLPYHIHRLRYGGRTRGIR